MVQHTPEQHESSEIHLQDYLKIILKHKWLILQVTAVFTITALVFAYTQPPIYSASGTLLVLKTPAGMIRSFQEALTYSRTTQVDTYLEILKSRTIMEKTIAYARQKDRLKQEERLYVSDMIPQRLRDSLNITGQQKTSMLYVSSTDTDRHRAADAINYLFDVFIEETYEQAIATQRATKKFIYEQLESTLKALQKSEEALRRYKEKLKEEKHIVNLSRTTLNRVDRIASYQQRIKESKINIRETETKILELRNELEAQDETIITSWNILDNPTIRDFQSRIANLEIKMAKKLMTLQMNHPDITALRTEMEELRQHIRDEVEHIVSSRVERLNPYFTNIQHEIVQLQISIAGFETRIKALEVAIDQEEAAIEDLPEDELRLSRLNRNVRVNDSNYRMIKRKYAEAEIAEVAKGKDLRIMDAAKVPRRPLPQRKKVKVMLGFIIGLALGISLSFLLDYLDTSLKTVKEAENLLGIPTLGVIPVIKADEATQDTAQQYHQFLVVHHKPTAVASEAYRILRTNLLYQRPDKPFKSLLITSANPLEGKTLSVSNLGVSLAHTGMNILLVDTDLRKPNLHTIFDLDNHKGFSTYFIKGGEINNYVQDSGVPGLTVLTTGPLPPNPAELLSSTTMQEAVRQMHDQYDFIIFDSPPLISVTDGAIIGSLVDGVMLVIELGRHSREAVLTGKRLLDNVKAPATGLIFNKSDLSSRYGYYYYYPYQYKPYEHG